MKSLGKNSRAIAMAVLCMFMICCASRTPPPKRASNIITHYFQKYGKKYKDSIFGFSRVTSTQIDNVEELHKHLVVVYSYVNLANGDRIKVRATMQKKTLGWKFISWENMMNESNRGLTVR